MLEAEKTHKINLGVTAIVRLLSPNQNLQISASKSRTISNM